MERPDQAKFDGFSSRLSVIDRQLQGFAAANRLEYLRDVKRQPNRELHSLGNPLLMFGLHQEGVWYYTEDDDNLLYAAGASGVLTAPSGARFSRKEVLLQHQPLVIIQAELEHLLIEWKRLISFWAVPDLTDVASFEANGWLPVKIRGMRGTRDALES